MAKPTYKEVKRYFAEHGCTLLAKEYKNSHTVMPYICKCKRESAICFDSFKNGGCRCSWCGGNAKPTYEEVKQYFADQGCTLLAKEYKNANTSMPYICECGKESMIRYDTFKRLEGRCKECGLKKQRDNFAHSYKDVKQYFTDQGCVLLAKEYINNRTRMPYICVCGNEAEVTFHDFKDQQSRCQQCGIRKNAKSRSLGLDEAKEVFRKEGCVLLAKDYFNNETKMAFQCKCGNVSQITLGLFQAGTRCPQCKPRSQGELAISKYLMESGIDYETEIKVDGCGLYRFDFKTNKCFIEHQGKQHYIPYGFGSKEKHAAYRNLALNLKSDHKKFQWCRANKTPLLIIPYWDKNRIPEILEAVFAGKIPTFSDPPENVKKHESLRRLFREKMKITEPEVLCGLFNSTLS